MSGEVMADVADAYRVARNAVELSVNERLMTLEFKTHFQQWAFIGILRPDDHPFYPEVFKKRRKQLEFRLKFDHGEFANASSDEQQNLIIDALVRCVGKMREFGMDDDDCSQLVSLLTEVRN